MSGDNFQHLKEKNYFRYFEIHLLKIFVDLQNLIVMEIKDISKILINQQKMIDKMY